MTKRPLSRLVAPMLLTVLIATVAALFACTAQSASTTTLAPTTTLGDSAQPHSAQAMIGSALAWIEEEPSVAVSYDRTWLVWMYQTGSGRFWKPQGQRSMPRLW